MNIVNTLAEAVPVAAQGTIKVFGEVSIAGTPTSTSPTRPGRTWWRREYTAHFTFKGDGTDNQGNRYRLSFIANEQFDAPSFDVPSVEFGSFQTFVVPLMANFVSRRAAPNYMLEGSITVFVVSVRTVGAFITAVSGSTYSG